MTPAAQPGARGQRVSGKQLAGQIFSMQQQGTPSKYLPHLLDLHDRNADVARLEGKLKMAEAALHQDGCTIRDLEAEIASLRAANAIAKRDGWIAGRDASAEACIYASGYLCRIEIEALAPPEPAPHSPPAKVIYPGPWRHNKPHAAYPDSVVYVIRSGAYVKIGTARNVYRRYAQLQIAHPEALDLLFWMPGGGPDEAALHARFHTDRVRGEWFRFSTEIQEWLEASRKAA